MPAGSGTGAPVRSARTAVSTARSQVLACHGAAGRGRRVGPGAAAAAAHHLSRAGSLTQCGRARPVGASRPAELPGRSTTVLTEIRPFRFRLIVYRLRNPAYQAQLAQCLPEQRIRGLILVVSVSLSGYSQRNIRSRKMPLCRRCGVDLLL